MWDPNTFKLLKTTLSILGAEEPKSRDTKHLLIVIYFYCICGHWQQDFVCLRTSSVVGGVQI